MNKHLCLISLFFWSFLTSTFACDMSLISLISGEDSNSSFIGRVASVSATIKSLGEVALDAEKSVSILEKLMKEWMEFDITFGQYPPDWAKNDGRWKAKLKVISNGIGKVRLAYQKKNLELAHDTVLSISRKISRLFEFMPMDETNRSLVQFAIYIDSLWDAFYADDKARFGEVIEVFENDAISFNAKLSKQKQLITQDFLVRINEVKLFSTPRPPSMSKHVKKQP